MNVVPLAGVLPHPWRNGGGSTRELLAWPHADDWLLRVSVATVAQSGAFSAFAGVDRWFAVVAGAGISLALPSGGVVLTTASPPLHFAGEAAPHAQLLAGSTQDLNFMVRRNAGSGKLRSAAPGSAAPDAAWRALFTAAALTLDVDGIELPGARDTLLWAAQPQPAAWRLPAAARAWWLCWNPL